MTTASVGIESWKEPGAVSGKGGGVEVKSKEREGENPLKCRAAAACLPERNYYPALKSEQGSQLRREM